MEPNQVKMLGFTKVGKSENSALQTKCILQAGVLLSRTPTTNYTNSKDLTWYHYWPLDFAKCFLSNLSRVMVFSRNNLPARSAKLPPHFNPLDCNSCFNFSRPSTCIKKELSLLHLKNLNCIKASKNFMTLSLRNIIHKSKHRWKN